MRIIVRSRAKWFEQGEKNTKYFLNRQKSNIVKKNIRKLKLQNDSEETDQKKYYMH